MTWGLVARVIQMASMENVLKYTRSACLDSLRSLGLSAAVIAGLIRGQTSYPGYNAR